MTPPGPSPRSLLQTIVEWVAGISTWNRAAIAIVLGFTVLTGYLIVTYPEKAFDLVVVVLHEPKEHQRVGMTLFTTDVQHELDRLLKAMSPDMIGAMAWRTNMDTNTMEMVRYAVDEEYATQMREMATRRWQYPVTIFRDNEKINDIMARIYIGRFVCTTPEGTWDEVLSRFPVAEICLAAIPPDGVGLAGMLAGAWKRPIRDDDRSRIEMAFRATAQALVYR